MSDGARPGNRHVGELLPLRIELEIPVRQVVGLVPQHHRLNHFVLTFLTPQNLRKTLTIIPTTPVRARIAHRAGHGSERRSMSCAMGNTCTNWSCRDYCERFAKILGREESENEMVEAVMLWNEPNNLS